MSFIGPNSVNSAITYSARPLFSPMYSGNVQAIYDIYQSAATGTISQRVENYEHFAPNKITQLEDAGRTTNLNNMFYELHVFITASSLNVRNQIFIPGNATTTGIGSGRGYLSIASYQSNGQPNQSSVTSWVTSVGTPVIPI